MISLSRNTFQKVLWIQGQGCSEEEVWTRFQIMRRNSIAGTRGFLYFGTCSTGHLASGRMVVLDHQSKSLS